MRSSHTLKILCALGSLLCLAGSAGAQGKVTSISGDVSANGQRLELHSAVLAGQPVQLSAASSASILVRDDTLVNLCAGALARFAGTTHGDAARVELDRGDLRVVAPSDAGSAPFTIETPTARIDVLDNSVHVSVAPASGDTVVSSLQGRVRVSSRGVDSQSMVIGANEQITVNGGTPPSRARGFDRAAFTKSSTCSNSRSQRLHSVALSSARLAAGLAHVSAAEGDPAVHQSELAQIVAADIPRGGIPLEGASSPSALIVELGKAGLDEEVCDPITCNPVFELPPPEFCGVPPQAGCIPGP